MRAVHGDGDGGGRGDDALDDAPPVREDGGDGGGGGLPHRAGPAIACEQWRQRRRHVIGGLSEHGMSTAASHRHGGVAIYRLNSFFNMQDRSNMMTQTSEKSILAIPMVF